MRVSVLCVCVSVWFVCFYFLSSLQLFRPSSHCSNQGSLPLFLSLVGPNIVYHRRVFCSDRDVPSLFCSNILNNQRVSCFNRDQLIGTSLLPSILISPANQRAFCFNRDVLSLPFAQNFVKHDQPISTRAHGGPTGLGRFLATDITNTGASRGFLRRIEVQKGTLVWTCVLACLLDWFLFSVFYVCVCGCCCCCRFCC